MAKAPLVVTPPNNDELLKLPKTEVRHIFTATLLGYYFGDLPVGLSKDIVLHFEHPDKPGLENAVMVPVKQCGAFDRTQGKNTNIWYAMAIPGWDYVAGLPSFITLSECINRKLIVPGTGGIGK